MSVLLLGIDHPLYAQMNEKELQNLESQEFGIEAQQKNSEIKNNLKQNQVPPLEDIQTDIEPEKINPIEAEEFKVRVTKTSRSGRVLSLEDLGENRPRPGKILLLKSNLQDFAAVRVLKNYPSKFAAKIVLSFAPIHVNQEFRALKKVGDRILNLIKEREKRGKDLDGKKSDEDLAKEISPDDNELDRGIPAQKKERKTNGKNLPKPKPLFNKDGFELNEADDLEVKDESELNDVSLKEENPLEIRRHAISLQFASMRSYDSEGATTSYNSYGIRYAFNFWRMPFFHSKNFQDMLSAELGVFYFSISPFVRQGSAKKVTENDDVVTSIPVLGTIRYNLLIGENLMFYPYLGIIKNNVSISDPSLNYATQKLSQTYAVAGIGGWLKLGPGWAIRLDFGTDLFGIGAVLKF